MFVELFWVEPRIYLRRRGMLEHHLEGLLEGQKGQFPYWWRCLRTYLQWTDIIFKKSDLMEHEINTGDYPPVKQPPHCALPHQREIVDKILGKLLASGRVDESRCPWSNPVVLARKHGNLHMCNDFQRLGQCTEKMTYLFLGLWVVLRVFFCIST